MQFHLVCEREDDGRWIAEIEAIPGVLAYGASANEAMARAEVLALRVLAEQLEHGEAQPTSISISLPVVA
jgi:predicted RNase H-like HicB family nuclease